MNRSYSKIRHIQEVNKRLEDRRLSVLSEQVDVSGYQGSSTDVEKVGIEDPYDMSNIKVTKEKGKVERKPLSKSDPIYQKIKDFFEEEFSPVTVVGIDEPIDKSVKPLVYEVSFPKKGVKFDINDPEDIKTKTIKFEVTIEDIEKKDPILRKRFLSFFDDIDKSIKTERTFRT
jgi:hypothetical protein